MQKLPLQFGRYTVRAVLAQTSMSTVYEAWDERIGRRVAIKTMSVIDHDDCEGQELLARFARGARAAGQLSHPNIVQVYDYAEQDALVYLVMELIEGRTLKQELDSNGAMDPVRIVSILGQVLQGLGYSHARGVVHRDMKPANILLTEKGEAKITDFGIARMERSDLTQPGMFIGTPSYMSPEQFRGDPVDFRTDIYSVGVILYQMLTARRPYEGGLATIMHKVLHTETPMPSAFGGMALAGFDPVVRRAMAKRPEDRFASTVAFARAIEAAADATAVRVTTTATRPIPAAPTVTRRPPSLAGGPRTARTRGGVPWPIYAVMAGLFVASGVIGLVRFETQRPTALAPPPRAVAVPEPTAAHPVTDAAAMPPQAGKAALPPLPIESVHPLVLPALPPQQASRAPPRRAAPDAYAGGVAAQTADADTLRRVLMRLSHQLPTAARAAKDAVSQPAGVDQPAAEPRPPDQNSVDEASLSALWYVATASPVGLLLKGNGPGDGAARPRGLSVLGVVAGSPAERAGCRAGDLILAVDDRPVTDPAVFDRLRTGQFGGGAARLKIIRDGRTATLAIVVPSTPGR